MNERIRAGLLVFNAFAAVVAAVLYCSSFVGLTLQNVRGIVVVFMVCFLLNCVLLIVDNPREVFDFPRRSRTRCWPKWAKWTAGVLTALFVIHFSLNVYLSGWGVPAIRNGAYVVVARGHILREIGEAEYIALTAHEMRLISFFFVAVFFQLALDWGFSIRRDLRTDN